MVMLESVHQKKKFGTGSLYFDGSSYLTVPSNEDFVLGDIYTIEFWVKVLDTDVNVAGHLVSQCNNTQSSCIYLYNAQSGFPTDRLYVGTAGVDQIQGPVISRNEWYHIAIIGYNGGSKFFVDGVFGLSTHHKFNKNFLMIGGGLYNNTLYGINGYIDDLRITKDIARYTSNFTVPTKELE